MDEVDSIFRGSKRALTRKKVSLARRSGIELKVVLGLCGTCLFASAEVPGCGNYWAQLQLYKGLQQTGS